ncbi:AAA family ATPase [Paenibacillus marinisediminis]
MNHQTTQIYILSGPCGVGKSTASVQLSRQLKQAVLIHGDVFLEMYVEGQEPPWEERLSIAWDNILAATRNFVQHHLQVVIDFVVETELEWFCDQLADLKLDIKYVVLRADEAILEERLNRRGDPETLDRSLTLLRELGERAANQKYLLDTSNSPTEAIVQEIMQNPRFAIQKDIE